MSTEADILSKLDKRQRIALRQAYRSSDGMSGVAPPGVLRKLVELELAVEFGEHEVVEWGRVVSRIKAFYLTTKGEAVARYYLEQLKST